MKKYISLILIGALAMGAVSCGNKNDTSQKEKKEQPFRFLDWQDTQIVAAQKYGLKHTFADRNVNFDSIPELSKVETCEYFMIEPLTHSVPYLRPNAKKLLEEIGRDFQDSLRNRGAKVDRIKVTSLLRTEADVERLQKVNTNASAKSTHCYGTTFDIAHNGFEPGSEGGKELTTAQMKTVLAHVLYRLRMKHKCWVLCEERQKCFHITVNS